MKNKDNKYKYGQVLTPRSLVNEMWSLFKTHVVQDVHNMSVFEPGCGKGIFYDVFCEMYENMNHDIYVMNEINKNDMSESIFSLFQKYNSSNKDQIIFKDFFLMDSNDRQNLTFDIVVGNLPFHVNGMKQVPSAKFDKNKHNTDEISNVKEGKTIWTDMVKAIVSDDYLKPHGHGMLIIPLIWMKPDKSGIYNILTNQCRLLFVKTYTSTEANKTFGYNAQTPLCYVIFQKCPPVSSLHHFQIYNHDTQEFTETSLYLNEGLCIPTKHISNHNAVLNWWKDIREELNLDSGISRYSLSRHLKKVCHMKKEVVEHRKYDMKLDPKSTEDLSNLYYTITGAELRETRGDPHDCILKGFIGTYPGAHHNTPKVILPHKRFGFSLIDFNGSFGIYGRDKYVFLFPKDSKENLEIEKERKQKMTKLHHFLKLDVIQLMIESFKIRMSFIEKYIFDYMPNIMDPEYGDIFYDRFMQAFYH